MNWGPYPRGKVGAGAGKSEEMAAPRADQAAGSSIPGKQSGARFVLTVIRPEHDAQRPHQKEQQKAKGGDDKK